MQFALHRKLLAFIEKIFYINIPFHIITPHLFHTIQTQNLLQISLLSSLLKNWNRSGFIPYFWKEYL
jgi:hypothetical protein